MTHIVRLAATCVIPLCMTIILGCESSTSPCVDRGPDDSLDPIDGHVRFLVKEKHYCPGDYCEPSIVLLMHTEKIYGCCNYGLESEVRIAGNVVRIRLRGVYKPDVCLTALGPAQGAHVLKLAPGKYDFRFCLGCDTDRYEVTITDEAIAVRELSAGFMESLSQLRWRFPHESFCYLCGTRTETSWICDAFLDSLMATGRFVEFTFPDSGDIPYPQGSAGHYYDMPGRYFRYTSEADFDTAGAILERYSQEVISQQPGVGLSLWNWKYKRYLSWLMDD